MKHGGCLVEGIFYANSTTPPQFQLIVGHWHVCGRIGRWLRKLWWRWWHRMLLE